MKLKVQFLMIVMTASLATFAQDQVSLSIKGNQQDISYLLGGFMTPALKSWSNALNQGWYNTAQTHKKLGFDITVMPILVSIPNSDLSFKVDNSQLKDIKLVSPANGEIPTFAAAENATSPQYQFQNGNSNNKSFPATNGADIANTLGGFFAMPMAQIGLGIFKGNELKIRYLPSIEANSIGNVFSQKTTVSLIGLGLMHDVKQHIPIISQLPFDLSAFIGYNKITIETILDKLTPSNIARYEGSAFTVQGLVSKKFSILTLYGSAGYNFATTKMDVIGTYDTGLSSGKLTNPASLSVSSSGPRVTAGARLKLLIFTLHIDYTLQQYSTITGGFGLSIR
jgi:hypothetical protein